MKKQPQKKGNSSALSGRSATHEDKNNNKTSTPKRTGKTSRTIPHAKKRKPLTRKQKEQRRTKIQKKRFLKALDDFGGTIFATCKATGIGRRTYYDWLEKDPEFAEKVDDVEAKNVESVEAKLFQQAIETNSVTAKVVYLKLKSKHARIALSNRPEQHGGDRKDNFPDPELLIKAMDSITKLSSNS